MPLRRAERSRMVLPLNRRKNAHRHPFSSPLPHTLRHPRPSNTLHDPHPPHLPNHTITKAEAPLLQHPKPPINIFYSDNSNTRILAILANENTNQLVVYDTAI